MSSLLTFATLLAAVCNKQIAFDRLLTFHTQINRSGSSQPLNVAS